MERLMEGKVGLVTGAARGIGKASAIAFAAEGAKVVVSDFREEEGKETVKIIKDAGGEAVFYYCDVRDEKQVENLVNFTIEHYGTLDWAHNNAGINATHGQLVGELETKYWDDILKTNLYGCFYGLKYEIRAMVKAGTKGAIVNSCSDSAHAVTTAGADYFSSKWGIRGLTMSAALDYGAKGIRVNSIAPGVTKTPMIMDSIGARPELFDYLIKGIPLGRMAEPEDQANAAVFLCSEKAGHITGVNLIVDGGQYAVL